MTRILPFFAQTATATIVIDGVTYRVPLVDAAGHLQVDVVSGALPTGAATAAKQTTMITALQLIDDLITALATVGTDQLRTDVISSALPTGAATATKQTTMITALQLIDDLQTALASVGTDRLNVNVKTAGASEVKSVRKPLFNTTARNTLITPTAGKKIRVISHHCTFGGSASQRGEVYFGTGANIGASAGKEVDEIHNGAAAGSVAPIMWPDGGGPVGAVDEVLSCRVVVSSGEDVAFLVHYREE